MKVTRNWLKQYVDFSWTPAELAERLTMLGIEVEGVEKVGGDFEGVVVAQVITRDKHPNADKLSVCRVNDGQGERQIVCGAQNFKAGDKVPLILPGATLPAKAGEQPFTIKVGRIRGVESHGMMCSAKELGISEDAEGLMILPENAKIGQPFADHLGRPAGDVLYDLEVTPNRPDLNSVIGIAREIAALTGNPLKMPAVELPQAQAGSVADQVAVRIEDPELCPRYTARLVRGVKVGPSPAWLRETLEKVGIRSISNVVDVTNFVMMEIGQPLHAFDYHLVAKGPDGKNTIVVRRARADERFTTLDGKEHTLTGDMLLIADSEKGIALAGVMGGQNSEINDRTVDVLIESAYFSPTSIRKTSKQLGIRTDASYRFERGADIGISDWASRRCAQLILETAGGTLAEGVVDAFPAPYQPRQITLRHRKVNELLGIQLRPEEMEFFLGQLGLKIAGRKPQPVGEESGPQPVTFQVPSWRVDLKRETDLIEEIERLYGVDKVPATPPRGAIGSHPFDAVHDAIASVRRILIGLGLNESQGQTLVAESLARQFQPSLVLLSNPLSSDMNVLRPSLLPGMLDIIRNNISRKNEDVALFEAGRVFVQANGKMVEERRVAIALTGRRNPLFWSGSDRDALFDGYDLKGMVEEFFEHLGLRGAQFVRRDQPGAVFYESAAVNLGKLCLGEMGLLQPALARRFDLRDPVWLCEFNLDMLLARRAGEKSYQALPSLPSIRRDIAMLVPDSVTHDRVLAVVKQARPDFLERVDLFDVFRGENLPAGQKSMAYSFIYRHADRTLTDAEVNSVHQRVIQELREGLKATIRE